MTTDPVLAIEHTASTAELARLGLVAGEMVFRIITLSRRSGQLVFEDVTLPAALFPGLLENSAIGNIVALAAEYGLQLGDAVERISLERASVAIAVALSVPQGTEVLKQDRIVHLRDGRPAQSRIAYSLDPDSFAKFKSLLGR